MGKTGISFGGRTGRFARRQKTTLGSQVDEDAFTDRRKTEGRHACRLTALSAMSSKPTTTTIYRHPSINVYAKTLRKLEAHSLLKWSFQMNKFSFMESLLCCPGFLIAPWKPRFLCGPALTHARASRHHHSSPASHPGQEPPSPPGFLTQC